MIRDMSKNNGFTLIELIVSFSVFVVLITLTTGTFIQALKTQRVVSGLSASLNDVSFVTEQMAREIRTGTNFGNADSEQKSLRFINANKEQIIYRFKEVGKRIERCRLPAGAPEECNDLTSPEVKINRLNFILQGNRPGEGAPRITIITSVTDPEGIGINVNLQTTVSARNID